MCGHGMGRGWCGMEWCHGTMVEVGDGLVVGGVVLMRCQRLAEMAGKTGLVAVESQMECLDWGWVGERCGRRGE